MLDVAALATPSKHPRPHKAQLLVAQPLSLRPVCLKGTPNSALAEEVQETSFPTPRKLSSLSTRSSSANLPERER